MEQLGTPFSWGIIAVIALVVAAVMIIYAVRTKNEKVLTFSEIDGVLKHDWARTGKIDFHVIAPDSTSPQQLILRVEEKKIIENAMGEEVVQLRWRLATVEEGKEVVVCWNARGSQSGSA
jgi:hypothetical protein